jgi:hypothetical protein
VYIPKTYCSIIVILIDRIGCQEEKEQPRGLGLVLLFMTPWRNPNSIFVYMFGILYVLGKYGEMKSSGAL